MKIDVEYWRGQKELADTLSQCAMKIWQEIVSLGDFCDECGETHPEDMFYPLGIIGPESISGLICNKCARKGNA